MSCAIWELAQNFPMQVLYLGPRQELIHIKKMAAAGRDPGEEQRQGLLRAAGVLVPRRLPEHQHLHQLLLQQPAARGGPPSDSGPCCPFTQARCACFVFFLAPATRAPFCIQHSTSIHVLKSAFRPRHPSMCCPPSCTSRQAAQPPTGPEFHY